MLDLQPRRCGELAVGCEPDAGDDHVGLDAAAVGQQHAGRPGPAAGDLGDLYTAAQVDAVLPMQVGEDLGDLAAEHPQQWQFRHFQHRHCHAGGPGRRRGLQADPAGTDHRDPGGRLEGRPDPVAVPEVPQVEHAVEVGARHGEPRGADPVVSSSLA